MSSSRSPARSSTGGPDPAGIGTAAAGAAASSAVMMAAEAAVPLRDKRGSVRRPSEPAVGVQRGQRAHRHLAAAVDGLALGPGEPVEVPAAVVALLALEPVEV